MSRKEEIIKLFYEEHKKPTEIAKELKVVCSYVTKVIQKDERYIEEKEHRKKESKEKHKICKRKYAKKKREEEKASYQKLVNQINIDNEKLSTKKEMSDEDFAKWNRDMFEYSPNSSGLKLKDGIKVGYAVKKAVEKVIHPSFIKSTNKICV